MTSRYRSRAVANQPIGLSISYQRENLLARGMGLEHLREALVSIARPLLRHGASLAYGGHWRDTEDNFTFELLRLISAEQEDNSLGGPDTQQPIGRMYNYSPWPEYLVITPQIEAQWINCCRIVRVTQGHAGISEADQVTDSAVGVESDRLYFNKAVVLSAMRRLAMTGVDIKIPDVPSPESIPRVMARIILGGKVEGFSGFIPGIFEEALLALEHKVPLYVLGGFGGAAEVLADALLAAPGNRAPQLSIEWYRANTPSVAKLEALCAEMVLPAGVRSTSFGLDAVFGMIEQARVSLSTCLNTGLDEVETRELLKTGNLGRAIQLVRKGLGQKMKLHSLPA